MGDGFQKLIYNLAECELYYDRSLQLYHIFWEIWNVLELWLEKGKTFFISHCLIQENIWNLNRFDIHMPTKFFKICSLSHKYWVSAMSTCLNFTYSFRTFESFQVFYKFITWLQKKQITCVSSILFWGQKNIDSSKIALFYS